MSAYQAARRAIEVWPALAPETTDVLEAAAACPKCINSHTPALQIKRIWGPTIREREPAESQADGGEGAE